MTEWQPADTMPDEGNILVWLEGPKFGSRVFPMRVSNIKIIGTNFAFDMPKVTH